MVQSTSFSLEEIKTNRKINLFDYEGRPVLIQFWVAWCPDCIREVPLIEQFYKSMNNESLVVLTINVTGREGSIEQRDRFIEKNDLTVPVLLDNGTKIYDQYDCQSVPTTILLDENHQVRDRYTDQHTFQDILYGISRLLTQ